MNQRLERVRGVIAERGLDGLVVTHPANRRYLTGYTAREELPDSVVGACFIDTRDARLLTGRTNLDWARAEVESRGFEADTWDRPWPRAVAKEIKARGWKRVGFEEGAMTVAFHRDVLSALEEARRRGMKTIVFLGKGGGFTAGAADIEILVSGTVTARIQEAHKFLLHVLCEMVEEKLPRE